MRRLHLSIFLISTALIAFEVSLIQYLSFVQWHHFAALVISVALLGFGASGTVISLFRGWMTDRFHRLLPVMLGLSGISMAVAIPATQFPFARFDSYLVFVEMQHAIALLATCMILMIPFLFGAIAVGLSFIRHPDDSGRIYFWNLLGSGLGAVLAVTLMWVVEPWAIASICGVLVGVAVVVFASSARAWLWAGIVVGASLAVGLTSNDPVPSQFKDIRAALGLPDARIVDEETTPHGIVQRVETPVTRSAPGLSLTFSGEIPVRDPVFVNGDAVGMAGAGVASDSAHLFDFTTRALPFELRPINSVLVLDAATGEAVAHALLNGARHVTAVEPNHVLASFTKRKAEGIGRMAVVEVAQKESRPFVEHETGRYDLIILPDAGRFGGTTGLKEMQEEYLFTIEAFESMWRRLTPDGCIALTAWMDYPYRNPVRAMSLLTALTSRLRLDPSRHIAAIRSWADATFVLCRSPISDQSLEHVRGFSRQLGFDPLFLRGASLEDRNRLNQLQDVSLLRDMDDLASPNRGGFIETHAFRIVAPTDDRPFFSSFLRLRSLTSIREQFGDITTPFFGLGLFIAVLSAIQAGVASILLIVVPLFGLGVREKTGILRTLLYFASLGLGFMFLEIVLIQRFTLHLGAPVYAVSVILGSILAGSGLGALASSRVAPTSRSVGLAAALVAVAGTLYLFFLGPLFELTIGLSLGWRLVTSPILVLPVAFLMGFPFPLGIRWLSGAAAGQLPWAWGVNGCFSVVAASTAPLLALSAGFTAVTVLAIGAYLLACCAIVGRQEVLLA